MQVRDRLSNYARTQPVVPCAQCGKTLFAPEWSEHLSDSRVRYVWACDGCDYEFDTLVCFPAAAA